MFYPPKKNTELYDILGLDKSCSREDIKKAYKKLAIKYHPDKLKADASEDEKKMFVKIHQAYEILYDDDKRATYDMYGIVDQNAQVDPNVNNMGGMANLFEMLFRFQHNQHAESKTIEPVIIEINLSLEEVITGAKKNIMFERNVLFNIDTNKTTSPRDIIFSCEACKGSGMVMMVQQNKFIVMQNMQPCGKCKATGYVNIYSDKYKFGKKKCKFDYNFKKGLKNGENIVLNNLGNVNPLGSNNGDVIMVIKYNNDSNPRFKIDELSNLAYFQQVSIFEAVTGTEFNILHPDGRKLKIKIPPIMPNFQKIVKKFGLPQNMGNEMITTDLIILFEIIYPVITDEQKNLLKSNFEEYYHITDTDRGSISLEF
jgi:DnaJ-class molecular chaperone